MKYNGIWLGSGAEKYREHCKVLVKDHFSTFRQDGIYTSIVGSDKAPKHEGESYIKHIEKHYPELLEQIPIISEIIDSCGTPPLVNFAKYGAISVASLRYIKVFGELQKHFGSLKDKSIGEIGPGYGGQAATISRLGWPKEYYLMDLPEPLEIIKKYIYTLGHQCPTDFAFIDVLKDIPKFKYDLVISDFCLSEQDDDGMKFYIHNVLSQSQNIYLTMNLWNETRKNLVLSELSYYFDLQVIPAEKEFHADFPNYYIIGKQK